MSDYRTIVGVVQFKPREGKAGDKEVRNIAVRQTGIFEKESVLVSATLWPEFDSVKVAEGDFVVLEGKYQENTGKNKEGDKVVYHNLSVAGIAVLGKLFEGSDDDEPEDEEPEDDDPADDDIPF